MSTLHSFFGGKPPAKKEVDADDKKKTPTKPRASPAKKKAEASSASAAAPVTGKRSRIVISDEEDNGTTKDAASSDTKKATKSPAKKDTKAATTPAASSSAPAKKKKRALADDDDNDFKDDSPRSVTAAKKAAAAAAVVAPPKHTISAADYFGMVKPTAEAKQRKEAQPKVPLVSSSSSSIVDDIIAAAPPSSPVRPSSAASRTVSIASPARSSPAARNGTRNNSDNDDNSGPPSLEKASPIRPRVPIATPASSSSSASSAAPAALTTRPPLLRKKTDEQIARELQDSEIAQDKAARKREEDDGASLALAMQLQEEEEVAKDKADKKASSKARSKKKDDDDDDDDAYTDDDIIDDVKVTKSKKSPAKKAKSPKKATSASTKKETTAASSPAKKSTKKEPAASSPKKVSKKEETNGTSSPSSATKVKSDVIKMDDADDDEELQLGKNRKTATKKPAVKRKIADTKVVKTDTTTTTSQDDGSQGAGEEPVKRKFQWGQQRACAPPPMLGRKDVPEGQPNCLLNLTFVISGTLESLEREAAGDLIKKYGGRVTGGISGKTSYLLAGSEAGEGKAAKAKEKKVPMIDEDGLFNLIRTRKEGIEDPKKKKAREAAEKKAAKKIDDAATKRLEAKEERRSSQSFTGRLATGGAAASSSSSAAAHVDISQHMLWVDKHKPTHPDDIVGQAANVKKLGHFLDNWPNTLKTPKAKRAILIAGPPGTGKSTICSLVPKARGWSVVEFNASDVRNKKSIDEVMKTIAGTHGLSEYFSSQAKMDLGGEHKAKRTCVVMDEVDGMSGNEDRGGIQTLIQIIKKTQVPIICICNDGGHPKVRSLKNYCEPLMWKRPTAKQIAPHIMAIAKAEGFKVELPALEKLSDSCRADMRQILNVLQMWRKTSTAMSFDQVKAGLDATAKDFDLGPFDVITDFFRGPNPRLPWIDDRIQSYFVDAQLIPLFVQENYLYGKPYLRDAPAGSRHDILGMEAISEAADRIAEGDLISELMYRTQDYGLMPLHAVASSVAPGFWVSGGLEGRVNFPSWLGRNSTRNKNLRLVKELKTVMSIDTTAGQASIATQYLPLLREKLLQPLLRSGTDGIQEVVDMMAGYAFTKDDFTMIMEMNEKISPHQSYDKGVDKAVKSAFTRALTAEGQLLKVARLADLKAKVARGGRAVPATTVDGVGGDEDATLEEEEDEPADDGKGVKDEFKNDRMIKQASAKAKGRGKSAAAAAGAPKKRAAPKKKKAAATGEDGAAAPKAKSKSKAKTKAAAGAKAKSKPKAKTSRKKKSSSSDDDDMFS